MITRTLAILFTIAVAAPLDAQTKDQPALDITFTTVPAPPKSGMNQFEVTVKDKAGKPVADAEVSVTFVMPAMPAMKMPEMRKTTGLKSAGAGKYTGSGDVMMAGHWNVTVTVKRGGKELGRRKLGVDAK